MINFINRIKKTKIQIRVKPCQIAAKTRNFVSKNDLSAAFYEKYLSKKTFLTFERLASKLKIRACVWGEVTSE